jgi:hypothetical protein
MNALCVGLCLSQMAKVCLPSPRYSRAMSGMLVSPPASERGISIGAQFGEPAARHGKTGRVQDAQPIWVVAGNFAPGGTVFAQNPGCDVGRNSAAHSAKSPLGRRRIIPRFHRGNPPYRDWPSVPKACSKCR